MTRRRAVQPGGMSAALDGVLGRDVMAPRFGGTSYRCVVDRRRRELETGLTRELERRGGREAG